MLLYCLDFRNPRPKYRLKNQVTSIYQAVLFLLNTLHYRGHPSLVDFIRQDLLS